MEKLDSYWTCNNETCNTMKYKVLIHKSKETLNNDLHNTDNPIVAIDSKNGKTASISKINLDAISTENSACVADKTLNRHECRVRKVNSYLLLFTLLDIILYIVFVS